MTKKKVLAVAGVLGIAALVLSAGTLAYFTDRTDTKTNTFTLGKVDIELAETVAKDDEGNDLWTAENPALLMPGSDIEKKPVITVQSDSQDAYIFAALELDHGLDYVKAVANLMVQQTVDDYKTNNPNATAAEIEATEAQARNRVNSLITSLQSNPGAFSLIANSELFGQLLGNFIKGFDTDKWDILASKWDNQTDTAIFYIAAKDGIHKAGDELTIFTSVAVPEELDEKVFEGTDFNPATIKVTGAAIQAAGFEANGDTPAYKVAAQALLDQWEIEL
jgi:predicted ribosomally synthesized peptide with SipW-like signal peptide